MSRPANSPPRAWRRSLLRAHSVAVYAFLYTPIAVLILYSFNGGEHASQWERFSFRWYAAALASESIRSAAQTSLAVAAITTAIATLVGTMAALALAGGRFPLKAATRGLLLCPIVIPEVVLGAALLTFFSVARWELGLDTIVIAHVVFSITYVAIVVRARLEGFDRSLEEAAADLGAPPLAVFLRVKLPLIMPGILAAALLVFTISLDDYVITSFVAAGGATTLPLEIYSLVKHRLTPLVNAVSTLLLLFTVLLIVLAQILLARGKPER